MNKSLILAAGILWSLVACQSRTERLKERVVAPGERIPALESTSDADNDLTVRPVSGSVFSSAPLPDSVFARMTGVSFPEGAAVPREELCYLRLSYYDFDGCEKVGEMVCHREIAQDLVEIFRALYEARYPIRSIRLIDDFGGDDEASMRADNTSCFNYRAKTGMRSLSKHAFGLAVDVNPLENPYVRPSGVRPAEASPYADRMKEFAHKIDRNDLCYKLFREHGFSWGGDWRSVKDYQHFEK